MAYRPDARRLMGTPYEVAERYGKPHIGARYRTSSAKSNRIDDGALCAVCGMRATNSHHMAPLGIGSGGRVFALRTEWGTHILKSSLVALCGFGNASGCHGDIHAGRVRFDWVWDSDEYARQWWETGEILKDVWPHSPKLYRYGCWHVLIDGRKVGEIRD